MDLTDNIFRERSRQTRDIWWRLWRQFSHHSSVSVRSDRHCCLVGQNAVPDWRRSDL